MPQPTPSDAHIDAILTNISIAFMQDQTEFVASRVFPIVPVNKQSDKYFTYTREFWFTEEAEKRAPSTESAGGGYELGTDSYFCDVWAIHKDIDDQLRANADSPIDLDGDATRYNALQLLMKLENIFVTDYFTTSVWTGAATGNDQTGVAGAPAADQFRQWNDASSNPLETIARLMDEMQQKTGFRPNQLTMGAQVWTELSHHPDILDRIKHTERGVVTREILAALLELDSINVARSTRNTANEGATPSYSFYWGKNALLTYSAPAPSLLQPSAGYVFGWTGYTGTGGVEGIGVGSRVNRMRMDPIRSDRIEAEMSVDTKIVAADLGVFLASAVN